MSYFFDWLRRLIFGESKEELQEKLADLKEYIESEWSSADYNEQLHSPSVAENPQLLIEERIERTDCAKQIGVITFLDSDRGVINDNECFGVHAAPGVWNMLKVGTHVEYLTFENPITNLKKVVKVERIVNENWTDDDPAAIEEELKKDLVLLKANEPTYFEINQCAFPGIIIERKPNSVIVDMDKSEMEISLDDAVFDFQPEKGDHVSVVCKVQKDSQYVDKCGEILKAEKVSPSRRIASKQLTVTRLYDDWGILDYNCFFSFDLSPLCKFLAIGANVKAVLIESELDDCIWRAIEIEIDSAINMKSPPTNEKKVIIEDNLWCKFNDIDEFKELTINIRNQSNFTRKCNSVEPFKKYNSLLKITDPAPKTGFTLEPGAEYLVRLEVKPNRNGKWHELIYFNFEQFILKRTVQIIVGAQCPDQSEPAYDGGTGYNRTILTNQRSYAQQVYSKKSQNIVHGGALTPRRRFVAKRIENFNVPENLRTLYLTFESKTLLIDELKANYPLLAQELNPQNYSNRFQYLLYLEEIDQFVSFRRYDRDRAHFERENEYLSLTIENLAECRPSLVCGDMVLAHNPFVTDSEKEAYEGIIHKVLFDRVLLKFNSGFQDSYNGEDYRLEFYFSRFSFRKAHHAITHALKIVGPDFIFPTRVCESPQLQLNAALSDDEDFDLIIDDKKVPWFNTSLNQIQKVSVCNVLSGKARSLPYVIFGPPGTGKTITVVEIILQLTKHVSASRILVATPSNSSANLITSRLIDSGALQKGEFVRLVSFNSIEKELIPPKIAEYCVTADIGIDGTFESSTIVTESGLKLFCSLKTLGRHRITIGTCTSLGTFLLMGFNPDHFTHVIIDESGQCTEPDAMIPIMQVSKKNHQVILAGDAQQLPPVVLSREAQALGFDVSFLDRILKRLPYRKDNKRFPTTCGYDPRLVTKLQHSYRALPSILKPYNEIFYHGELIPTINDKDSREVQLLEKILPKLSLSGANRPFGHGAFFRGVLGENKQDSDSPSWYNPAEAQEVFGMMLKLLHAGMKPEDIGIITPYIKQVRIMRHFFQHASLQMPKIGTVEEFQGQERDVIIVSTVRSNYRLVQTDLEHALGFVKCPKRMNVAISRSRSLLIVIGNPHLLYKDPIWNYYIKYCVDNDAYSGCVLPNDI